MFSALLFALSCATAQPAVAPQKLDVTTLTAKHDMTVTLESDGCWHSVRYEFQFQFSRSGARVSVSEWNQRKNVWTFLHDRDLAKRDVQRIQNLLSHLRQPPQRGCTTTERMRFDVMEGGRPIASESYVDRTCAGTTDASIFVWSALI